VRLARHPGVRARAASSGARYGPPLGAPDDAVETLSLIVTELATNAVRHSGSPGVTLLLCVADGMLTAQVKDSDTWRPQSAPPGGDYAETACGGRGLLLVEAYAADCTVRPTAPR
jgi:anti-sigma regulatory factor (Ser/Thr protein kinase)